MKKSYKKYYFVIGVLIITIFCIFNIWFGNKKDSDISNNLLLDKYVFGKYEVYDNNIVSLLKYNAENKFVLANEKFETLYTLKQNAFDFYFLDKDNVVYITKDLDADNSTLISVYIASLADNSERMIYQAHNDDIYINVINNKALILNKTKRTVFIGNDASSLNSILIDYRVDKIINTQNRIFFINYFVNNNKVNSNIYELTEEKSKFVMDVAYKISNLEIDYNNPNKLFISYTYFNGDNTKKVLSNGLFSSFIINNNLDNDGIVHYNHLPGDIYSTKNGYYFIDNNNLEISILNSDLSVSKKLYRIHNSNLKSFVRKNKTLESLYIVDHIGKIIKV